MIIERTKNEVIFRLSANISVDELQNIAGLFEFEEIGRKSKAKQKDVDILVKQIKKDRWTCKERTGIELFQQRNCTD